MNAPTGFFAQKVATKQLQQLLSDLLLTWCGSNSLPFVAVAELLKRKDISATQKAWLKSYSDLCDSTAAWGDKGDLS